MTPFNSSGGRHDEPDFECRWRPDGFEAATVVSRGTVDRATAPRLAQTITEALAHARLVLIDFRGASFVGSAGTHAIAAAAGRASQVGARLVVVGAPDAVQSAVQGPRVGAQVEVLDLGTTGRRRGRENAEATEVDARIRPLDNPVNASVLTARAMSVASQELWFQSQDGSVGRAWAPQAEGFPVAPGAVVDVYLDDQGAVNGWWEPVSNVAVNQRLFDPLTTPETISSAACQGRCGIVWQAPAATRLAEHGERCLTCSGHLVLR